MSGLREVGAVDAVEASKKFTAFERAHQIAAAHARIGALVSVFSNDELHHLAEFGRLTIGDVLDLRRLGLLRPDEGWTGGPRPPARSANYGEAD